MKIELGSGYHPDMSFDIHIDINPKCPHLEHVCSVDKIPYPNDFFDEARSSDVLEHFSFRDTLKVLREWYRILKPNGKIYIQCPNAKLLAKSWLEGTLPIFTENGTKMPIEYSASYWIMGGQEDNNFARSGDDWRWNAHYTLFSPESLKFYLELVGFRNIDIQSDGGSNLLCWAYK